MPDVEGEHPCRPDRNRRIFQCRKTFEARGGKMVFSAGLEATALRQAGCLPLHQETVFGATPETATGTGALPSNVPAGRPMAVWGGRTGQGAFQFLSREGCEGGEVAERCGDNSPAIHGWVKCHQHKTSPVRDGRKFLPSLTGLGTFPNREPSHEWLGYFQGQRCEAENGHRDGRAPQQSPSRAANGSLGWTNGAKGG